MPSAIWRPVVPGSNWRCAPSGNVRVIIGKLLAHSCKRGR
jgi:hypothetical protein